MLQYASLAFTIYLGYISYAVILLIITVGSGFLATRMLYEKRMALYRTVQQSHLVPIVIGQYVRYAACATCWLACMLLRSVAQHACAMLRQLAGSCSIGAARSLTQ